MADDVFEGPCRGGPLDGATGQSRFPEGFLAIDKPNNLAWVYDWRDGEFVCRDPDGHPVSHVRRWETADSSRYDIRAV